MRGRLGGRWYEHRAIDFRGEDAGKTAAIGIRRCLYPVAGRPMLDRLLELYAESGGAIVMVVNPSSSGWSASIASILPSKAASAYVNQGETRRDAAGILRCATLSAQWSPDSVWITWCESSGDTPGTGRRLWSDSGRSGLVFLPSASTHPNPLRSRGGRRITAVGIAAGRCDAVKWGGELRGFSRSARIPHYSNAYLPSPLKTGGDRKPASAIFCRS